MERLELQHMERQMLLRNGWHVYEDYAVYKLSHEGREERYEIVMEFLDGTYYVYLKEFNQRKGDGCRWDDFFEAFGDATAIHYMLTGKVMGR